MAYCFWQSYPKRLPHIEKVKSLERVMKVKRTVLVLCFIFIEMTCGPVHAGNQHYDKSLNKYNIPDVKLTNQDNKKVNLQELLKSDKPIFLDFVFVTCTTICPVLSASFANLQRKLDGKPVHFVSFTIDPENDTPDKLKHHLERYQAKAGWDFLTGSREDIVKVMHAFDASVDNKMKHLPFTFFKSPKQPEWVRINGLVSTKVLIDEYKSAVEN